MTYIYLVLSELRDHPDQLVGFFSTNKKAYDFLLTLSEEDREYLTIPKIEDIKNTFLNEYEVYGNDYAIMKQELDLHFI